MNSTPLPLPLKKKNKALSLVKPINQSSLSKFQKLSRAETEIEIEISKLGDVSQLHNEEPQLIHLICNLVENLTDVKLTGQEKKDLVIKKITSSLTHLDNPVDLKWISKTIDMLCLVGAVSKVASSEKTVQSLKSVCNFFSKN